MIRELGQENQEQVKFIQPVPSFKEELSALRIISEIVAGISVIDSAGKLCSWARSIPLVFLKVDNTSTPFLSK